MNGVDTLFVYFFTINNLYNGAKIVNLPLAF